MALGNTSSMTNSFSHTNQPRRTCACSPSNHPGSFRCIKHKKSPPVVVAPQSSSSSSKQDFHKLNRSRMAIALKAKNSLTAILLQIIQHHSTIVLYRRKTFQPRPSRFLIMNALFRDR
ncbi:unnamed protein product [Lathyrus oleraceus]